MSSPIKSHAALYSRETNPLKLGLLIESINSLGAPKTHSILPFFCGPKLFVYFGSREMCVYLFPDCLLIFSADKQQASSGWGRPFGV